MMKKLLILALLLTVLVIVAVSLLSKKRTTGNSQKISTSPFPHPQRLEKLLTPQECDQVIELAQKSNLQESKIYDSGNDKVIKNLRESQQAWVKAKSHSVLDKIADVAARLSVKPRQNQEDVQVVKYGPGGFYNPHYDACEGTEEYCKSFVSRGGQRYATLLVYLSDGFTGGGTHFPKLNFTAVPKKGDAIFFYSTDEQGQLFPDSQHGGQPVQSGDKWIANVWVRHGEFT